MPRNKNQQTHLLHKALNFLKFRPRSEHEIIVHLNRNATDTKTVDRVLGYLLQNNLVNDSNFADWLIHSRLKKGKGLIWCRRELSSKFRIKKPIIDSELNKIDQNQVIASASKQLQKKHKKSFKNLSYKDKSKLKQHLYQRGYSSNIIRLAFDEIAASE